MLQLKANMEDKFLEVAKQAAIEAGQIIAKYFGKKHQYTFKNEDKSDFITQADLEAQKRIIEIITKNFPDHNIIAEENVRIDKGSEYTWAIDPLDGTFAFSIGMPYFSVSVGLIKNKQPFLGVVNHVSSGDLYYAERGKGAFKNGQSIHVSSRDNLFDASLAIDFGHKQRRQAKIELYILPLLKELGHVFSTGSSAFSLALTASGIQDGITSQAWIWDFAAGVILVTEAGGKVTDLAGKEVDWTKDRLNILASNRLVHEAVLKVLNK